MVEKVEGDCLWVHLGSSLKGRVEQLDASRELTVLENLKKSFKVEEERKRER